MAAVEGTNNKWEKWVSTINSWNTGVLIFIFLVLNFLTFIPHTNEEQYLMYAVQAFQPNWVPGSLMATEFPGTRFLFEWLFGGMAYHLGFEKTVLIGRLINYLLLAFPIAAVFKTLKFSNIQTLFVLQIFWLTSQNFYAGEWIFGPTEAKTFAYIFIFLALQKFLQKSYYWVYGYLIIATYFHILIGGWFAISITLVLLFRSYPFWKLFKLLLFYGIPLLPFLYYLGQNMLAESLSPEQEAVNLNYIYVYFRNKHHIGLFYTFDFFVKKHLFNVLGALVAVVILLRWNKAKAYFQTDHQLLWIRDLILAMSAIGFFFLGVSLMDNLVFDLSGGFLLKSYPFRMQGLAFLMTILLAVGYFTKYAASSDHWIKWRPFVFILIGIIALTRFGLNINKMSKYQMDSHYNEVVSFLDRQQPKPATVMVLKDYKEAIRKGGHRNTFAVDLIRRTRHDNFFHFKYIPSTPKKMYEWYQRSQIIEKIEADPKYLNEVKKQYTIDYILTTKGFKLDEKIVFENEVYQIYQLK